MEGRLVYRKVKWGIPRWGHLNIGAGRIVYQELARINNAIASGELASHPALLDAINNANASERAIHLMGLVSDGGVHSHISHLKALCDILNERASVPVYIHAFTDGRDVDPRSGLGFIEEMISHTVDQNSKLVSVIGRYYAMDRDKRWERTALAYDMLVNGQGKVTVDIPAEVRASYDAGVTDEFIKPIVLSKEGSPVGRVKDGDTVLFFNFRTDRPRQLVTVLTQQDMPDHNMHTLDLQMVTMTQYDDTYSGITVLFHNDNIANTMGEYLSSLGKTQLRIAETEKYPHVTFFFSGGREAPFQGEQRILIPSPKVATYDLKPSMSALEVTDAVVDAIIEDLPDFICLNYANADMVGHTGVMEAAMEAVETVDQCLTRLVPAALEAGYGIVIIADHGNSDTMKNPDGSPHTAHTMNPVPVFVVSDQLQGRPVSDGILADIAPTLLFIMGIPKPPEMTGKNLIGEG